MNLPPKYGTQVYRFPSKGTSLKLEHCSSLKSLDPSGQSWILQDWYTLELPSHLSALRATSLKMEEIINHMEWVMHDHEKRTCHPYDIQVRIVIFLMVSVEYLPEISWTTFVIHICKQIPEYNISIVYQTFKKGSIFLPDCSNAPYPLSPPTLTYTFPYPYSLPSLLITL